MTLAEQLRKIADQFKAAQDAEYARGWKDAARAIAQGPAPDASEPTPAEPMLSDDEADERVLKAFDRDYSTDDGWLTPARICQVTGMPSPAVRIALYRLKKADKIVHNEKRRGSAYQLAKWVSDIYEAKRANRPFEIGGGGPPPEPLRNDQGPHGEPMAPAEASDD